MDRRKFLIGTGSAAIGGSVLVGSGAFSRVESQRAMTIQVAEDPNAYLGLNGCEGSANSSYTEIDPKGHLAINMNPENPNIGDADDADAAGLGVNSNSRTWFDNVFQICNQGKKQVCVYIEDAENSWPVDGDGDRRVDFYYGGLRDESIVGQDNAIHVPLGECFCVGIRTNTKGLSEGEGHELLEDLDNEVTIIADASDLCWDPEVDEGAFAWIPNKIEPTVSKVNLTTAEAVARYRLIEENGDEEWRSNRGIASDVTGDAWVLNTGYDGTDLQGSVVQISAGPVGPDNTSEDHDDIRPFGEDDRVTKFELGGLGDVPRALTFDDAGYLWVGFHFGRYFLKLDTMGLDEGAVASEVGDPGVVAKVDLGEDDLPYNADYANGRIWVSNREDDSTRRVFAIDTAAEEIEDETIGEFDGPYFINPINIGDVEVVLTDGDDDFLAAQQRELHWYDGEWNSNTVSDFDGTEPGAYQAMRGSSLDQDDNLWVVGDGIGDNEGLVLKFDPTDPPADGELWEVQDHIVIEDAVSDIGEYTDQVGQTTAIAPDPLADLMWVVTGRNKDPGSVISFDPETGDVLDQVEVGNRPYTYADFTFEGKPDRFL